MESRKSYTVCDGNIFVFGDLHLSSSYEGQHIDYLLDCYKNMDIISEIVSDGKPSAVVFLGDIVGVRERNIRDRQFLMRVIMFFECLNGVTGGNVFSVKGNHDIGDFSDFDFFVGLGLIKNPEYLDYYAGESHEIRFHFVNYGSEKCSLSLAEDASNVVFGHSDYFIEGVTNWYSAKSGVELATLDNMCGVVLVVSGHIHIPSDEILYTTLKDGGSVGLFYPGSPSRTAERFDDCWYLVFSYEDGDGTNYEAKLMGIPKAADVFHPKEDFIGEDGDGDGDQGENSPELVSIVQEIIESRITSGDIENQIRVIPGASDETKELAIQYYRLAVNGE